MENRKELILLTVDDLVSDFLYYSRKGDEELPRGEVESAIMAGEVSVDDIVTKFEQRIRHFLDSRGGGG